MCSLISQKESSKLYIHQASSGLLQIEIGLKFMNISIIVSKENADSYAWEAINLKDGGYLVSQIYKYGMLFYAI